VTAGTIRVGHRRPSPAGAHLRAARVVGTVSIRTMYRIRRQVRAAENGDLAKALTENAVIANGGAGRQETAGISQAA
jgi:hypothetical protein